VDNFDDGTAIASRTRSEMGR